jgi:hypothetical protein
MGISFEGEFMKFRYLVAGLSLVLVHGTTVQAAVEVMEKDGWTLQMGGFVETDLIKDNRGSFTEVVGNSPVDRPDTAAGQKGRTQMSVRNSRLSFNVMAPPVDNWKTRAYFEYDLLGYEPSPGKGISEAGYFNNPTFRARHLYVNAESEGLQILTGQTWALLGWQPYYFVPTLQVSPIPGELYSRTAQIRVTESMNASEATMLQFAAGVMRPPQRDSGMPSLEAGARIAFSNRTAGFTAGPTGAMKAQPMSIGISGTYRDFEVPSTISDTTSSSTSYKGSAVAVDALIPILASSDGKDVSNTLMLGGEFTNGVGYGDQFSGWTGNQPNPLNSSGAVPDSNVNLDAGIGGFDSSQNFSLLKLQSYNIYLQYFLPSSSKSWISAGSTQLVSGNISDMKVANGGKVAYNKTEATFLNFEHELSQQIRIGIEYARIHTVYTDDVDNDNTRYQVSTWFIF